MRQDAVILEDERLKGFDLKIYPWFHERHRIFPEIFEKEYYENVLDIAAGIGIVGKRIQDTYPCFMLCNDISNESIKSLKNHHLKIISFDLDEPNILFPFKDKTFDAIISLATIEHIINLKNHLMEIRRILRENGHLYISAPNYSSIHFVIPFLLNGKSFHNPLSDGIDKYEFYAHVRYFTYKTLNEFVSSFGFHAEKIYLPLPKGSSRYLSLRERSKILALSFKCMMYVLYKCLSPRWAFHPVIRFSKTIGLPEKKYKKPNIIIL